MGLGKERRLWLVRAEACSRAWKGRAVGSVRPRRPGALGTHKEGGEVGWRLERPSGPGVTRERAHSTCREKGLEKASVEDRDQLGGHWCHPGLDLEE